MLFKKDLLYAIDFIELEDKRVADDILNHVTGLFIKEYPNFFVFKTYSGYHVCVLKVDLITGEATVQTLLAKRQTLH